MEVEKLYTHIYLDSQGNLTNRNLSPVTKKERSSQAPNAPGRWLLFLAFRGGERSRGNILFIYLNFLKSQHKYSDPPRLRLNPGLAPCEPPSPAAQQLADFSCGVGGSGVRPGSPGAGPRCAGQFFTTPQTCPMLQGGNGDPPDLPLPRAQEASEQRGAPGAARPGRRPHISPPASPHRPPGTGAAGGGAGLPLGDLPPTLPAGTRPSPGALGVGTGRRGILALGGGGMPLSLPPSIFCFPIFFWGGGGGGGWEYMCVFSLTMGASAKCSLHSCPAGKPVPLPDPHFVHSIPGARLGFPRAPRHRQTLQPLPCL